MKPRRPEIRDHAIPSWIVFRVARFSFYFIPTLLICCMICWSGCRQHALPGKVPQPELSKAAASVSPNTATVSKEVTAAERSIVDDEILIKFRPGSSAETVDGIARRFHLEKVRTMSIPDLYLFKRAGNGRSSADLMESLRRLREVDYAEPNYERKSLR